MLGVRAVGSILSGIGQLQGQIPLTEEELSTLYRERLLKVIFQVRLQVPNGTYWGTLVQCDRWGGGRWGGFRYMLSQPADRPPRKIQFPAVHHCVLVTSFAKYSLNFLGTFPKEIWEWLVKVGIGPLKTY